MNIEKILRALFAIIDLIHDANIVEWIDFAESNVDFFLADFTDEEKMEIAYKLQSLNLELGSRQWWRRFYLCRKIHDLI